MQRCINAARSVPYLMPLLPSCNPITDGQVKRSIYLQLTFWAVTAVAAACVDMFAGLLGKGTLRRIYGTLYGCHPENGARIIWRPDAKRLQIRRTHLPGPTCSNASKPWPFSF